MPAKIASQSPGRVLGGGRGGGVGGAKGGKEGKGAGQGRGGGGGGGEGEREDARGAAGRAAEVRALAVWDKDSGLRAKGKSERGGQKGRDAEQMADSKKQERAAKASAAAKGKMGKELQKERQKTVGEQLAQGSREERRRRDVDGGVEIRGFN